MTFNKYIAIILLFCTSLTLQQLTNNCGNLGTTKPMMASQCTGVSMPDGQVCCFFYFSIAGMQTSACMAVQSPAQVDMDVARDQMKSLGSSGMIDCGAAGLADTGPLDSPISSFPASTCGNPVLKNDPFSMPKTSTECTMDKSRKDTKCCYVAVSYAGQTSSSCMMNNIADPKTLDAVKAMAKASGAVATVECISNYLSVSITMLALFVWTVLF
jgi:hypothetical protein